MHQWHSVSPFDLESRIIRMCYYKLFILLQQKFQVQKFLKQLVVPNNDPLLFIALLPSSPVFLNWWLKTQKWIVECVVKETTTNVLFLWCKTFNLKACQIRCWQTICQRHYCNVIFITCYNSLSHLTKITFLFYQLLYCTFANAVCIVHHFIIIRYAKWVVAHTNFIVVAI